MSHSVIIRNEKYNGNCHFGFSMFELSDFQKWAIDAFETGKNVLITAHTGSGKTYPAEHAILKSILLGKKIIYTSPIKSLSNQKFNDFENKFKIASVGILTGDIKYNPGGNVLVMTTEILRNLVLYKKIKDTKTGLDIELDIETEIGCIIFDEIHYINDADRGHVWEETLILLPKHIQLMMLSATIDNPEWFCEWLCDIKEKDIVLTSTYNRVVPLRHCLFTSFLPSYLNNKSLALDLKNTAKKMDCDMVVISDTNNTSDRTKSYEQFNSRLYERWSQDLIRLNDGISKNTIIQDCVNYLWNNDLCPAIFFTFSRTRCEILAKSIHKNLLEKDQIAEVVRITDYYIGKSYNRQIYENLKQWNDLKECLYKGIAFHHSGLVPLFKEIVELLYGKNLIKILFATETFAVGINMPTRTVVFTSLEKMVGNNVRNLSTAEYLQMAGRAGRRGIDTLGTVIVLPYGRPNAELSVPSCNIMRELICGKAQALSSKFSPDFQFILKMILLNMEMDILVEKSLYHKELVREQTEYKKELDRIISENTILNENINDKIFNICKDYDKYNNNINEFGIQLSPNIIKNNKKKADELRQTEGFQENYKKYKSWIEIYNKYTDLGNKLNTSQNHTRNQINCVLSLLHKHQYIIKDKLPLTKIDVTKKGIVACAIQECNGILMAELLNTDLLDDLNYFELAGILSLFSDSKPIDKSFEDFDDENIPESLYKIIEFVEKKSYEFEEEIIRNKLNINMDWHINRYIVGAVYKWMNGDSIKDIIDYYNVFEGNFIKDMLKIYNIAGDLIDMAKIMEKNKLSVESSKIVKHILRDIVNIESIYIKSG
jgi:superfamily II RNA helicase